MYGLFYHINVPLVMGYLVNAEWHRGYFGYMSLLRQTAVINFMIMFRKWQTNSAVCGWLSQLRNGRGHVTLMAILLSMYCSSFSEQLT